MAQQKRSNLLQFALIFAAVYFGSQYALGYFFPEQFGKEPPQPGVYLTMTDATLSQGNAPEVTVANTLGDGGATVILPERCPQPPLDAYMVENPSSPQEAIRPLSEMESVEDCADAEPQDGIVPGDSALVSLAPWKYLLFNAVGTYELRLPEGSLRGSGATVATGTGGTENPETGSQVNGTAVARFTVSEPGFFTKIFRTFITAPFLNALIFFASILPGYNLGWAIVLLTIVVKLLLFFPTQHALEGQKKMQLLQPKLEALKKQYHGNQQKIQEETMRLWKEHKINPVQSCLPTLIQFPILIGLFYVIRDGSHLEHSQHLIYSFYQNLDWTFGTQFLGLDLLVPNWYVMPVLLVALQFIQMKLTFAIQDRKKAKKDGVVDITPKGEKKPKEPMSSQQIQQQVMLYGLPLMIGFFAIQFPAAVAVYWGVSTLFGIGQQLIVNREHLRV